MNGWQMGLGQKALLDLRYASVLGAFLVGFLEMPSGVQELGVFVWLQN